MLRRTYFLALSLLLGPVIGFAGETPDHSPAFTAVPQLTAGFDLLYEQKFAEAREVFASWESCNSGDPFGEVAVAASYLFEELHLQGVLTSDFFLNEKRFLHGIDGRPDPARMSHFREALARARELAREQLAKTAENGLYLKPFAKIVLALAARREKQDPLAQKLLRGLTEQYPGNELFASEYAKASGMPLQAAPAR